MKCFETFQEFDDAGNALNWRACSTEEVISYIHGDPLLKPNARTCTGQSENEAIAMLCFGLDQIDGRLLTVVVNPKFSVGQRVRVPKREEFPSGYYGIITCVYGWTGAFSSVLDDGLGLRVRSPYCYEYTVEDTDGNWNIDIPEEYIELVEDDGA